MFSWNFSRPKESWCFGRGLACDGKSCSATGSLATVTLHYSTLRYMELLLAFHTVHNVEGNRTMGRKYFKFTRG